MGRARKINRCKKFFDELSRLLADTYEVVASCNRDISAYLIPKGTKDQITYHSKPAKSFRISDHWNWYANVNKCADETYIQCESVDIPQVNDRKAPGRPSEPIEAIQVAVLGDDGKYHHVYGAKFDRETREWAWIESDPVNVVKEVG